jgi:tetratricopeptide (TPR) repeat protein
MSLYRRGETGKESLPEIRELADRALRARPNWFELQLVSAELDLVEGKESDALKHFEKAQELGRPNGVAVLQHVRLLLNRGQYARAKELLETLPAPAREGDLGQVYAEVLFNTGHPDEAADVIQKFAEGAPDNADRQLAMGQMLTRIAGTSELSDARRKELLDRAGKALHKAAELRPDAAQAWLALLTFQVMQRDAAGSFATLQQAQLALPEDQLVAVMAKGNEIMGQWFNAENVYLTAMQAQPDNLPLAQELATFYLGQSYPLPDKVAKAAPLVNRILHAGAEGKLPPNAPSLMWARRAAAQMLSAGGEYQQLLKAEKFLASNSQDGILPAEDQIRMAEILAPRPEPISKIKAKNLLEQVKENQQLDLKHDLMLGQLYFAIGDWQRCRSQMQRTVSRNRTSAQARGMFISMLLQHGDKRDLSRAVEQMAELQKLAPNDVATVQLTAEIGAKTGREAEARRYLLTLLPKVASPEEIDERQIPLLEFVATLLVKLGDLDDAEKIYRMIVAREPNKLFALAEFLGSNRDTAQCMDILEKNYKVELTQPAVRVAISVVRDRRDEIGDKYDSQIQGWLDRGLLENPDSIPMLMLQAEFDDVQKRYDDAAAVYSKLLTRRDVTGITRAVVLNNLAFLVAVAGNEAETGVDPLKLVQEAAQILGPTSDILDTRAVVFTTQGKYDAAIEDLNYAVTADPAASKYYHLAVAHLGAGNNSKAIEAWQKAHDLTEDVRSTLNRMELDLYDKTKAKIQSLSDPKLTRTAA